MPVFHTTMYVYYNIDQLHIIINSNMINSLNTGTQLTLR